MANPRTRHGEDEVVVLQTRRHWLVLLIPLLGGAAVLLGGSILWSLMPGGALQEALRFVVVALCIGLLGWWVLPPIARWAGTRLTVTDQRLVYRRRLLGRFAREVPLERLAEVTVSRSLLERMIGTGDLMVRVVGEPGRISVPDLPRPDSIRELIGRQVEGLRARSSVGWEQTPPEGLDATPQDAPTSPGAGPGVVEQLRHLAELRDRGVVSAAEFQRIKEELLRRL
jgi:hypothetical protein